MVEADATLAVRLVIWPETVPLPVLHQQPVVDEVVMVVVHEEVILFRTTVLLHATSVVAPITTLVTVKHRP